MREHARAIWQAAVDAVKPELLIRNAFADPALALRAALRDARRIVVVGAGKAGAAMAAAVEAELRDCLDRIEGSVNVPAEAVRPSKKIGLHAARPAGSNFPTAEGIAGAERILKLVSEAGSDDVCLCLLSGGGSALLPAPAPGLTLEDELRVTQLLHASGATINEMNAVRKHLSAIKGGRLAQAFSGRALFSLIISDVIGDPLDVIASGPTVADPTTFANALAICQRFDLLERMPATVLAHLRRGAEGVIPETLKCLPDNVTNLDIGNNAKALGAARQKAEAFGYRVLNLGSFIEGETGEVATVMAGLVRSIRHDHEPLAPPVCVLSGGETTVTLPRDHGQGGRNQQFVLAAAVKLGARGMHNVVILSGGTDGEDGPTDAAGAIADADTLTWAEAAGLSPGTFLARHDAYSFFKRTGSLLTTGLTDTNVMDVRVFLVV
jgi:hydroxypyruvate reductase/glycerate 2-kinase